MAKMGRPKIKIDWTTFEAACKLLATKEEVLNLLSVNETTLDRRIKERYKLTFEGVLKKYGSNTKISLRRFQLQLAEKNVAMAIWLGKQMLYQKDKHEVQVDNDISSKEEMQNELDEIKTLLRELGVNEPSDTSKD